MVLRCLEVILIAALAVLASGATMLIGYHVTVQEAALLGILAATLDILLGRSRVGWENGYCISAAAEWRAAVAAAGTMVWASSLWWLTLVAKGISPATPAFAAIPVWLAFSAAFTGLACFALRHHALKLAHQYGVHERIVVVGEEREQRAFVEALKNTLRCPFDILACVTTTEAVVDLRSAFGIEAIDRVIIVSSDLQANDRVARLCELLEDLPVEVYVAVDCADVARLPPYIQKVGGFALFSMVTDPQIGSGALVKRGMDIVLASAALFLCAPVLLLAALALLIESGRPVLFHQKRFGVGGRPITVLKFRTMYVNQGDSAGMVRTARRDPRVTRVGRMLRRTSIDELPQLVNVLRGEMSLVGPRPHPLQMLIADAGDALYHDSVAHYRARHVVRPGITGWAQINGSRGSVETLAKAKRRVELDLWYLNNWSIELDLFILLKTALGGFASPNAD